MSQNYFLILTVTGFLTVCSESHRSCLALCRLNPSSPDRYEKSAAPLLGYRGFWCRWPARRKVGVEIRRTCRRHVRFAAKTIVPALLCADGTLRVRTVTKNPRHPFWDTADFGAGGRTRTGTLSPAVDFESTTSTNSITPAGCDFFRTDIICLNRLKCKHFFIELALNPQNTVTEAKIHDTCRSRSRRRRCMIRFSSREIYDCEMPSRSATSFCVFSFCPLKPKRRETI